jgi:U1 small nuclear ribonucleoprotein
MINSDPRKTIFIGRLSYETNESTIKKYFENYGDIRRVRLIKNKEGKSRGYAFVEFKDAS